MRRYLRRQGCRGDVQADGPWLFIAGGHPRLALTPGIVVAIAEHSGCRFSCCGGARYGCPSIFNPDHGARCTGTVWIDEFKANGIKISMDGKGRWMDNVFVERRWRSLKYKCVYLNAFDNMKDVKQKLNPCIDYYNHERPHSSLNDQAPHVVYFTDWVV